jgi:hypothetical protein
MLLAPRWRSSAALRHMRMPIWSASPGLKGQGAVPPRWRNRQDCTGRPGSGERRYQGSPGGRCGTAGQVVSPCLERRRELRGGDGRNVQAGVAVGSVGHDRIILAVVEVTTGCSTKEASNATRTATTWRYGELPIEATNSCTARAFRSRFGGSLLRTGSSPNTVQLGLHRCSL